MRGGTGGMRIAVAGWCLGAGLAGGWGCGEPTPPAPAVPEPPAEPPEPPYPVVSRCENATIRVGAPRRIDERVARRCSEEYEVDFVVEGGPGDSMLLDMFQSHTLLNWRVRERGERVEHAFSLRMKPWTSLLWVPGVRTHEPMVLQGCPEGEGEGPVLACTTERCGIYDDVDEVPALMPSDLELAATIPTEWWYDVPIRAGIPMNIPVTFRSFRPLSAEVTLRLELLLGETQPRDLPERMEVELVPAEIRLPAGWTRTETIPISVRVTRYDPDEAYIAQNCAPLNEVCAEEFRVGLTMFDGSQEQCTNRPPLWVHFLLLPAEDGAAAATR